MTVHINRMNTRHTLSDIPCNAGAYSSIQHWSLMDKRRMDVGWMVLDCRGMEWTTDRHDTKETRVEQQQQSTLLIVRWTLFPFYQSPFQLLPPPNDLLSMQCDSSSPCLAWLGGWLVAGCQSTSQQSAWREPRSKPTQCLSKSNGYGHQNTDPILFFGSLQLASSDHPTVVACYHRYYQRPVCE